MVSMQLVNAFELYLTVTTSMEDHSPSKQAGLDVVGLVDGLDDIALQDQRIGVI